YSLRRREVEEDIWPCCHLDNLGVIVYSRMASGLVPGGMTPERVAHRPEGDWRKHSPDFNEPKLSTHLALVERLRAIGKRHDCFPGAVAVAWTLRHPAVTAAIVGARKPEQVDDVIAAAAVRLTQSDLDER